MTLLLIIYLVWFVSVTLEYKNRFTARRFKVCGWDSFFYFVYWHHLASADPQWIRCCFDIKKFPRRNQFPRKDVVFSSCVPAYLPLAKSPLTVQMFLYMDYARCQNVKITSKFHTTECRNSLSCSYRIFMLFCSNDRDTSDQRNSFIQ